ncbi:MAG TPA: hypothetical protein PLD88_03835, partial [Candidatus Berkiella sp.]|nr:hypothetical protein [Candidatus Berkiella sp.]
ISINHFVGTVRNAASRLHDVHDCDTHFIEIARDIMNVKFPDTKRFIFSDANFLGCISQGNFVMANLIYQERNGIIRCSIDDAFNALALARHYNVLDVSDLMAPVLMRNKNIQEMNLIVQEAARREERALLIKFFKDIPIIVDIDAIIEDPRLLDEDIFSLASTPEKQGSHKRRCCIQ